MSHIAPFTHACHTPGAITRAARRLALALALLAALAAMPRQAAAAARPFSATVAETFTLAMCEPTPSVCVTVAGSGHATHLGLVREAAFTVSDSASDAGPDCHPETRATTLTAANGDQLTLQATGRNCLTGPTTLIAWDDYVVTGGTGRFSGASGSGTIGALVNLASLTATVTFSGALSSVGPGR